MLESSTAETGPAIAEASGGHSGSWMHYPEGTFDPKVFRGTSSSTPLLNFRGALHTCHLGRPPASSAWWRGVEVTHFIDQDSEAQNSEATCLSLSLIPPADLPASARFQTWWQVFLSGVGTAILSRPSPP